MSFHIGDTVIHCNHGLGEIVSIEEKVVQGHSTNCYVVRTSDLLIWIPINDLQQHSLRAPTPPKEFKRLSAILSRPGEKLQEDRALRRNQLLERLTDGQLASICRLVRDLTYFKRVKKLNDQEKSILERAMNSLLTEWIYSLEVPMMQARQAMMDMLGE